MQTFYLRMTAQQHLKLYQNQIIPIKYTSFNTYEHGPRIFRHIFNIQYLNTLLCLIIVYSYYYYFPMTIMDYNHSIQEHIRLYLNSTMVSTI